MKTLKYLSVVIVLFLTSNVFGDFNLACVTIVDKDGNRTKRCAYVFGDNFVSRAAFVDHMRSVYTLVGEASYYGDYDDLQAYYGAAVEVIKVSGCVDAHMKMVTETINGNRTQMEPGWGCKTLQEILEDHADVAAEKASEHFMNMSRCRVVIDLTMGFGGYKMVKTAASRAYKKAIKKAIDESTARQALQAYHAMRNRNDKYALFVGFFGVVVGDSIHEYVCEELIKEFE